MPPRRQQRQSSTDLNSYRRRHRQIIASRQRNTRHSASVHREQGQLPAGRKLHLDDVSPGYTARMDSTLPYQRQVEEAGNRAYERAASNASTHRERTRIRNQQINYNTQLARRTRQNSTGVIPSRREQLAQQQADRETRQWQQAIENLTPDTPIFVTRQEQDQLWDKDKVDLARTQQAFYRDAYVNTGVNWGNNLNPYTQQDLIQNAAKAFGTSNLVPYTLPATALLGGANLPASTFMATTIGGEVGGLVGSQVLPAVWDNPYAGIVGGIGGSIIGGGTGALIREVPYMRLANAFNNNIRNAKASLQYIRPDFNRFRLGDVEINNPSLYYRQGSKQMGDDFLNTGIVREGGGYKNPMFARGRLWYGIPTKEMLTQGRQTTVGRFRLTKANEIAPKTDLLVSTGNMVPSDQHAMPRPFVFTKERLRPYSEVDIKNAQTNSMRDFMLDFNNKYYNGEFDDLFDVTHTTNEYVRRIPASETSANKTNTNLYRFEPGYGYRRYKPNETYNYDYSSVIYNLNRSQPTRPISVAEELGIPKGKR